ncbi:MAG: outer membrane beta-barrel protein [Bacteroidota bacterium]
MTTSTTYDSIGRTISKNININGSYFAQIYCGTSQPFFSKKFQIEPNGSASYQSSKSFVNNELNLTKDLRSSLSLQLSLNLEKVNASISGRSDYNKAYSTLNSINSNPYTSQGFEGNISIKLSKKIVVETNGNYTINSRRTNGYNINYFVWNASLEKTFFKLDNFILGIYAYDILNQNISVNRSITSNIIIDTKINIISRYFLFKASYKFNSSKSKEEEDEL